MSDTPPPFCYVCKKDFVKKVGNLHYCICDTALCEECLNSVKTGNKEWTCPKCGEINDIKESKLFREKKV